MRKMLISTAFGAATLAAATIGSVQPASADVDFYVGTPGVTVGYGYNPCRDYWYRREHPRRCSYYRYRSGYPYYRDHHYRDRYRDRCWSRWYRNEHPYRCRYYYRYRD